MEFLLGCLKLVTSFQHRVKMFLIVNRILKNRGLGTSSNHNCMKNIIKNIETVFLYVTQLR